MSEADEPSAPNWSGAAYYPFDGGEMMLATNPRHGEALLRFAVFAWAATLLCGCTPEEEEERVIAGDVRISTRAEVEKVASATAITGRLTVKRAQIESLSLPRLRAIGGKLYIQKNPRLVSVSLPALESIGTKNGDVALIERNPVLSTLDFRALSSAAYQIAVRGNGALRRLVFPTLMEVRGLGLVVAENAALEEIVAPNLIRSPSIEIIGCPALRDATLSGLEATASLVIEDDARLARLDLAALVRIARGAADRVVTACRFSLSRNSALTSLSGLESLTHVGPGCAFALRDNARLPTCDIGMLLTRLAGSNRSIESEEMCGNLADDCGGEVCSTTSAQRTAW
jgi:hypothetical protein